MGLKGAARMRQAAVGPRIGRRAEIQRRLVYYFIPILIGLGGLVFSRQFDHPFWRAAILTISVALPLYAVGNLLARYHTGRIERLIMLSGVMLLVLGAVAAVTGITENIAASLLLSPEAGQVSRIIGIGSLFLGLAVVLYSVVRTGEDTEEIAERFRLLAEHITDGFVLSTGDGTICLVNQRFLDMFGVARSEVVGSNARELAERFDMAPVREHLDRRAQGVASEYEMHVRVGDREKVLLFSGVPVFSRQGGHTATIATVRDITEHARLTQRVEQYARELRELVEEQTRKLQASEEQFRNLLLSMNEGFLTVDRENDIRFVNARFAALVGLPEEDLLGRDIFDLVEDASRSRLLNLLARSTTEAERGLRQEIEFLDSDGRAVPAVVASAPLPRGEGQAEQGHSLVVTGIAEIRRMQQKLVVRARELERANEELRMHDRAKDSFLSNVSHELRTPLSTIQGYVELFGDGGLGALSEAQQGAVRVMERNVGRLLGLINEMIEYSRMQIRGIQPVYNLFTAQDLAAEAVAAIHPDALEKNLQVRMDLPGEPLHVWADREKMAQVIGILLNNAVKFTGRGGNITVTAEAWHNTGLSLTVEDDGIGIAPAYHARVFDRFFQVDSSKARQYEGTGIGLSLAKNMVEAQGGSIHLRSALNEGAVFTVHLPDALFAARLDGGEETRVLEGKTLLVAGEREDFSRALAALPGPAAVHWAPGGYQAVRKAAELRPDLLVINESSGDVLGRTTLRLLRQNTEVLALPALVCTMESDVILAEERGHWPHTEFLVKPFHAAELDEAARRLCAGETVEETQRPFEPFPPARNRRYVFVIDTDPGMREWVATALKYRDIGCMCTDAPPSALDMALTVRPDAIFLDGDAPGARVAEVVRAFTEAPQTTGTPVYVMTGLRGPMEKNPAVAGVIRKPFTISELADIIQSA